MATAEFEPVIPANVPLQTHPQDPSGPWERTLPLFDQNITACQNW